MFSVFNAVSPKHLTTIFLSLCLMVFSARAFGQGEVGAAVSKQVEVEAGASSNTFFAGLGYLRYQFAGSGDIFKRNRDYMNSDFENRVSGADGYELYLDWVTPIRKGDFNLSAGALIQFAESEESEAPESASSSNDASSSAVTKYLIKAKVTNYIASAKLAYHMDFWLNRAGVIAGYGISKAIFNEVVSYDGSTSGSNYAASTTDGEEETYEGTVFLAGLFIDFSIYESFGSQVSYSRLFVNFGEENDGKPNADSYAMAIALRMEF